MRTRASPWLSLLLMKLDTGTVDREGGTCLRSIWYLHVNTQIVRQKQNKKWVNVSIIKIKTYFKAKKKKFLTL